MKYLVTGGCGFIGSHIVEALLAGGGSVRVLDNLSSGYERNLATVRKQVELVVEDVRHPDALSIAMQGVDYVFHEAALVSVFDSVERPIDNHEINITGTLNVLQAARAANVKRVVVASSAAIYGDDRTIPKREDMLPKPASPYGLAKIAKEYYMSIFAQLYGMETVSLRYFNVYGPRQDPKSMYSGVISKFCDVVQAGQNLMIFGDGRQTRDFVYVGDVVQANLKAMHTAGIGKGNVYNIGTGVQTSLLELVEALRDITGRKFTVEHKPARAGDVTDSLADITRARSELNYAPQMPIRDGLRRLLKAC
jgi:UDP-glucose 4-epimerase